MIAAVPNQGGAAWAVLQYMLGLERLGHEVLFVEQCEETALRPEGASLSESDNGSYFQHVTSSFGLEGGSALLLATTEETVGVPYAELVERARHADILLNISGILTDERLIGEIPIRVYLDLDPGFAQLWQAEGIDMRFGRHTHFVTVGQAIGSADCPVPTGGVSWIPTLPPVVLARWPRAERITHDALTTIGNWRAYGSIEHRGVHYGQKVHSMRQLIALPSQTDASFLLALVIHPDEKKDLTALEQNGWKLVDAPSLTGTPAQYQEFIQGSRAEFGIAKSGYVASRCGWFSDRRACYLASGRPVLAQETGFSHYLPTGEGLFAFESSADVLAAIEELDRDYAFHCRAARALAEDRFDSDKVLERLLKRLRLEA
jgi:hypothetical protein